MIGGPPFLMLKMLTSKLGQGISLAIRLGSRSRRMGAATRAQQLGLDADGRGRTRTICNLQTPSRHPNLQSGKGIIMPTFEQSIKINATPAELFRLTQDYNHRLDWDPFLKEARLVGAAQTAGIGVRAWCVARSGLGMETEYVSFNPPKTVAVKMTRGPAIIASFAGSWRFQELSPGRTLVIFRYHVAAAPRWLGFALDPIMRLVFTHDLTKRLNALKRTVETTDLLLRMEAEYV